MRTMINNTRKLRREDILDMDEALLDTGRWAARGDLFSMPGTLGDDLFDVDDAEEDEDGLIECAVIPLRDTVLFPRMVTPLFVGRERSMYALRMAHDNDETVIVVAQRDPDAPEPELEDLYAWGCEIAIGRMLRMPDGTTSVLAQGRRRVQIVDVTQREPYMRVRARPVYEETTRSPSLEALMRAVLALFEKVVQLNRAMPEDAYVFAMNIDEPGWLADLVASTLDIDLPTRQAVLETLDPAARLQKITAALAKELDVLELEDRIHHQVQREVDHSQREYYLREQLKAIQSELGESDLQTQEINELRTKVAARGFPDEIRARAEKELERLAAMPPMAPEVGIIRTYVDWLLDLPWREVTEDNLDVQHAAKVLDAQHYGLPKAKDRILEFISVKRLAPDKMRSPILCFVGPPGTGKTSLGKSIAAALGRKFVRVSLGGVRDEAEIRGHRRTYIGALPGRILQTMRRAGAANPLFMLDEIDKLGMDFRGDPSSALLEVLDPEQNYAFSDHYLDVPYDLSKVLFVTTANYLDPVPPALRDRLEVIECPGYIEEEKIHIARQFLIPRQLEANGLSGAHVSFDDGALQAMIREYTYEAGVRNLEREIANVCRKLARRVAEGRTYRHRVTAGVLHTYLGPPQFSFSRVGEADEIGVANGLAWTEGGGDTLAVEVTLMDGKGSVMLTGQLGEIMQESAQAALSYTRSHALELGIAPRAFDKTDVHVHVPEGAIPKDGPSAGITIATALISAFTRRPVRRQVAMTGEITLRGRVLPIGGVREKVLAAHRAGMTAVVLPRKNEKDLVEIPRKAQRDLKLVLVDRMEDVLTEALAPIRPARAASRRASKRKPAAAH
jgi:ATP-dependent Lon protease